MPLYPRNASAELDMALFRRPTCEYRGAPFWSWNCKLDKDALCWQLEQMKLMGLGGGMMHSRVGLATEYLGPEFMECVKAVVAKARKEKMLAWLYDEDRWPSGAAGGLVTRERQHRMKFLRLTVRSYEQESAEQAARHEKGTLIARYAVRLEGGCLASYQRLSNGQSPPDGATVWHAYLETPKPSPWYNNQTYADTHSRKAIERFIEATHERYRQVVGGEFGKTVPAIFTDEPNAGGVGFLARPEDQTDVSLPWTTDLPETYHTVYGEDILESVPELVWELPERRASRARYRYHDHHTERFACAFADTIGAWCAKHGIALTGHMLSEETLRSQTAVVGEAMRHYRGFQLPGIDMLCDRFEFTTAKQAQSAARQFGREGVLSELYGVTNWDFDFAGHKRQGDWQAALGVSVRVPHLAWASMGGEAKRDYPAAIGWQSPWYREYPLIEDHFARLNTVLTRGRPVTRIGVIHPIESYWLCWGPMEQVRLESETRETAFQSVTEWLLYGLLDFDFISESLLPRLAPQAGGAPLEVGRCAYDVVVVPMLRTIRATTLDRLEAFADAGGKIIIIGEVPELVDAESSGRALSLAKRCVRIRSTRAALLRALEPWRELAVSRAEGGPADCLVYQLRQDADRRYLFICSTSRDQPRRGCRVELRGAWKPTLLDTFRGLARPLPADVAGGRTRFRHDFEACGHLLLQLDPPPAAAVPGVMAEAGPQWSEAFQLADPVPVTLEEPNVLLLDQAAFRLDDGPWEPGDGKTEEILRIGNIVRQRLGWPGAGGGMAQPWTEPDEVPEHAVTLRFNVDSDVDVRGAKLALEEAAACAVLWDGKPIHNQPDGFWVDAAIKTVALPRITRGRHRLEVRVPYGRRSSLEWLYLLGEFGVEVAGRHARLTAPVRRLSFGDWTRQGLPFYAGNVTYHLTLEAPKGAGLLALHTPLFRAPLLTVALDGRRVGPIAFPPHQVELGRLRPGKHRLDLTAFGCRINAFGALHNIDPNVKWWGPSAWRSTGSGWAYEYALRPQGVLSAPRVMRRD